MSLETATFISGLTESWPPSGDPKSQGDDHLRLIKSVLKSTFPTGSRAFYFPVTEAVSGTITLDATDQNNTVEVTTTGGNVTVNLPSTLGVGDKGWACQVVKVSNDANAAIVTPASGTIASKVGATATIRVGILCEPATFTWNGTGWRSSKPGPMIGSTESFDGASVPSGYLIADGAAYSTTNFAELFAVLASGVVRDKRGRVEAGVDGGTARLTATFFGGSGSLGTTGGLESAPLDNTQIPSHAHTGTTGTESATHTHPGVVTGGTTIPVNGTGSNATPINTLTVGSSGTQSALHTHSFTTDVFGGGLSHKNVQPTIVVQKIIRAC